MLKKYQEIYDKVIEIKAIARDPGSKSKVAVYTTDSSLDPVGPCVGSRGSRIQSIINEVHSEKIDIVKWSKDAAKFVINALSPAKVSKVIVDEDEKRMETRSWYKINLVWQSEERGKMLGLLRS